MATYTPNYNLSKPESTDDYRDFINSYGDNMDKIDNNMGGGGGGGGHTIVDPTGTDMPQENKLQFTGNVSVSDDSANGQTVVDVKGGGGNVYGAFIDTSRVIVPRTQYSGSFSYTATEDCYITLYMVLGASIEIDGEVVFACYSNNSMADGTGLYLRKGQILSVTGSANNSSYAVYGLTQGTSGIYAPVIYSDTERVIGVWRDNKPLYQKTIDVGALPNSTTKTVNYDVANVDAIVKIFGIGIAPTGGCCPIPFSDDYSSAGNILLDASTSNGTIRLISQSDKSPFHGYITIQYTKTTDTAGSGNWNTDGVPTHHYSTNEQVIGTWIDGKPLYEKTFELTQQLDLTQNTWVKSELDQGTMKGLYYVLFTNASGACLNNIVGGFIDNKIAFNSPRAITFAPSENTKVTLQYTKNTD